MLTEPSTPLNDADHAGSFDFWEQSKYYGLEANKFAVDLIITDEDLEVMMEYTVDNLANYYGLPREIIELRFK